MSPNCGRVSVTGVKPSKLDALMLKETFRNEDIIMCDKQTGENAP